MNGSLNAVFPNLGGLAWVDWTLLALLAISAIVGLVRGFVFECLSLAGWVVAWFAAQWATPHVAPVLPIAPVGSPMNQGVAFALSFIATLLVWALVARLVRMMVHATPLSLIDRLLGTGFGLLRGLVILMVAASVIALSPVAQSPGWRQSQGAVLLEQALAQLKPLLPPEAARYLPGQAPIERPAPKPFIS